MYQNPVFEFAEAQARVRARLGSMPGEARWRYIADATELDNLIGRMRDSGLGHWVQELPRQPDTVTIEDYLRQRLWACITGVGRLLPPRWAAVRRWLRLGTGLLLAERMLLVQQLSTTVDDPVLGPLQRIPLPQRRDYLRQTRYWNYLDSSLPVVAWFGDFPRYVPSVSGREGYIVHRLRKLLDEHHRQIRMACERALREDDATDTGLQWRLRGALAEQLRGLVGGYPFHAGLILTYGLLELLQYERCRALLVGRSRHWEQLELLAGAPA